MVIQTLLWWDTAGIGFTPPFPGYDGKSRVFPSCCHWHNAAGNLHVPRSGVSLFKYQVGVSECCPCFVWSVITLAQVLLAQVPAATEKVATKSIAGQGGAACLTQETGTGMEVQAPEQTKEKRSWYIFFFLDNRTGLNRERNQNARNYIPEDSSLM